MPSRRALIAGCGELGRHAGALFLRRRFEVFGVARSESSAAAAAELGIRPIRADLSEYDPPDEPFDAVVFCAAPDPSGGGYDRLFRQTLPAFLKRLAARPPRRLIYTSSTGVYDFRHGESVDENTPVNAMSVTGLALRAAEDAVQAGGIPSVIIRLGGIYGPGRNRIEAIKKEVFTIEGGDNFANNIHVDDAAGCIFHLSEQAVSNGTYIGVDDLPVRRAEMYGWIARRVGARMPPLAPAAEGRAAQSKRCSNRRLRASGYRFRYPTFREGYEAILGGAQ